MKPHTKLYLKHFGYGGEDFIPCELCGSRAVDIHHIDCRGMGGTSKKDSIENLMALCREHHLEYGDKKEYRDYLVKIHNSKLKK